MCLSIYFNSDKLRTCIEGSRRNNDNLLAFLNHHLIKVYWVIELKEEAHIFYLFCKL